jgi:hypothetical protein
MQKIISLYHATTKQSAESILKTKTLKADKERHVYVSNSPTITNDYGDGTLLKVYVDPRKLELDDEFPTGRRDYRLPSPYRPEKIELVSSYKECFNIISLGEKPMKSFNEYVILKESRVTVDINEIAKDLKFVRTTKKKLMYKYVDSDQNMPPLSYTVSKNQTLHTPLDQSTRQVKEGDILMSGPKGEVYSPSAKKFATDYVGEIGGTVYPEQSERIVAQYNGEPITFVPSWGGTMIADPGDYIVKEGDGKYYRIEKEVFDITYNSIN